MWALPVRGGYVTDDYGPRAAPTPGASTYHLGVDVGGRGTDWLVRSVGDGVVLGVGTQTVRGRWVVVEHPDGSATTYQHLASIRVTRGLHVTAGTVLGVMGATGTNAGTHLHLEVHPGGVALSGASWLSTRTNTVDPEPWLRARGVDLRTGTVTTTNPGGSAGGGSISIPGAPGWTLPEEDDMPTARLVRHPSGTIALVDGDGTFVVLSSTDESESLRLVGVVRDGDGPGHTVQLADGLAWSKLAAIAARKAAQSSTDPARIAASVAALVVPAVIAALPAGALTQEQVEAAAGRAVRDVLGALDGD